MAFNTHWKNKESRNLALKEQQYQSLKGKGTWALGTRLLIIPELRVLVTKRHVGFGNEIAYIQLDIKLNTQREIPYLRTGHVLSSIYC